MKTLIVGLTGQSGAGKTTVCDFFKKAGYGIVNCDKIAHRVLQGDKGKAMVLSAFPTVSDKNGEIDRKALGKIVFSDKKLLCVLNSITHPLIFKDLKTELEIIKKSHKIIIVDAPTLFESGADKLCDTTVGVVAGLDVLIKRLCERDSIDKTEALNRIKKQHDIDFFKNNCEYIIKNNDEISALSEQTNNIILKLNSKI